MTNSQSPSTQNMAPQERKTAVTIGSIYALRLLGLFMALPVLAAYLHDFPDATPTKIGLALGIYGLTQALMQIPMGSLSDKLGRKPVIAIGLAISAIGSLIAGFAQTTLLLITGRAIQGAGAIGSTLIALMADLTRAEQRSKCMAVIGMMIGSSFFLAMILGPLFAGFFGVSRIFIFTSFLAILGIVVLYTVVPTPQQVAFHPDSEIDENSFLLVISQPSLVLLDLSIFMLHAILTASFVAIPVALEVFTGVNERQQAFVYIPVLLIAFCLMLPGLILAEKKQCLKLAFLSNIGLIIVSQLLLWKFHANVWQIAVSLTIFLTAFSFLEASLPAWVSRVAPKERKGAAVGVYSFCQFFGIFCGGLLGGLLYAHQQLTSVFFALAILAGCWLFIASFLQLPNAKSP